MVSRVMAQKQKNLNLALQGGGAHGALTWGILDKLLEDGRVRFDAISATSAGAMNAVILAHGLIKGGNDGAREALHEFWKRVSEVGEFFSPVRLTPIEEFFGVKPEQSISFYFFDLMQRMFTPSQLNPANFNPLRDILVDQVDFAKIRDTGLVKVFISATNVKTGKIKIFTNNELSADAVMASACLPFIFPTVEIDGEFYWDGGYMGNPALFPLIYNSLCPDILILHINPINRDQLPENATDILNRMNEISFNSSLLREMRVIAFISRLLDEGKIKPEYRKEMKRVYMHAIRSDITMQSYSVASKLLPSWKFLKSLYEEGRREAEGWLKQHYRHIGKKASIDINEYL